MVRSFHCENWVHVEINKCKVKSATTLRKMRIKCYCCLTFNATPFYIGTAILEEKSLFSFLVMEYGFRIPESYLVGGANHYRYVCEEGKATHRKYQAGQNFHYGPRCVNISIYLDLNRKSTELHFFVCCLN